MFNKYFTYETINGNERYRSEAFASREECESEAKQYSEINNEKVVLICWAGKYGPGCVYGSVG